MAATRPRRSEETARGAPAHRFGPQWIPQHVDVRAIRRALNMTQQEFAERFGFSTGTVRNWEQGHRQPDRAARVLLTVVSQEPEAVARSLARASEESAA